MGEVTDYVAGLDEPERSLVARLVERARAAVPEVEEGRSYGLAALRYRGRPLVAVVRGARGVTVYPFSSEVVAAVHAGVPTFPASKGGIRCTVAEPLPDAAFDALVSGRRDQIDAGTGPRP
jgi:uncharacterized protein YdhG (YjbR/CyaY superfamily)